MEIWKDIPGFEGLYSISDTGCVYSHIVGRPLSVYRNMARGGYRYVNLRKEGRQHMRRVAVLVMLAFVGPRPLDYEVCHNDGSTDNDCLSNLRYATRRDNQADRRKHGTHLAGERHPFARLSDDDVRAIRASKDSARMLAARYGVSSKHINSIHAGRRRG